jgi:hexosaminidase
MLLFLALSACTAGVQAVVPLPATASSGSIPVVLASGFTISTAGAGSNAVLASAIARIEAIIFAHGGRSPPDRGSSSVASLQMLQVNVSHSFERPRLGGDESYSLLVGAAGTAADSAAATLTAPTINGALHGLQTFAQLCQFDYDADAVVIAHAPWSIDDRPRFTHRGTRIPTPHYHGWPHYTAAPSLTLSISVSVHAFTYMC